MKDDNGTLLALGSIAAIAAIRALRGSRAYWQAEGEVYMPHDYEKTFHFEMSDADYNDPSHIDSKFDDALSYARDELRHSDEHASFNDWERVGDEGYWEREVTSLKRLPPSIRDLKRGGRNTDNWTAVAFKEGIERHSYDDEFWVEPSEDEEEEAEAMADSRILDPDNLTYEEEEIGEDGIRYLGLRDHEGKEWSHTYVRRRR